MKARGKSSIKTILSGHSFWPSFVMQYRIIAFLIGCFVVWNNAGCNIFAPIIMWTANNSNFVNAKHQTENRFYSVWWNINSAYKESLIYSNHWYNTFNSFMLPRNRWNALTNSCRRRHWKLSQANTVPTHSGKACLKSAIHLKNWDKRQINRPMSPLTSVFWTFGWITIAISLAARIDQRFPKLLPVFFGSLGLLCIFLCSNQTQGINSAKNNGFNFETLPVVCL